MVGKAKRVSESSPARIDWRSRRFTAAFILLAAVLCLVAYHGVANYYFLNDDFQWMRAARYEMRTDNVLTYRVIGFFRPLVNLSFYVTERLAPGSSALYYYTNLILHLVNSILVFFLARRVLRDPIAAAAAGLYFVVTSAHFGAVIWISARTTLISTCFLLSALVLVADAAARRWRVVAALVAYALALASKETAVVGLLLVALLYVDQRLQGKRSITAATLAAFGGVTLAYLVVRKLAIGGFVQPNWQPGLHALTNVAGAAVHQYMSLPVAGVAVVGGRLDDALTLPGMELLVIPLLAIAFVLATMLGRQREIVFAIAWSLICLLPMAPLRFRFLDAGSMMHTRYYYLSSIGLCLGAAIFISAAWHAASKRRALQWAVAAAFLSILAIETLEVHRLKGRWQTLTEKPRTIVTAVAQQLDKSPGLSVCLLEDPPFRYEYLEAALELERSGWRFEQISGGEEAAEGFRPCLYVRFVRRGADVAFSAKALR